MDHDFLGEETPTFYGATTIGERGQIVIPANARKDLDLTHSTKVMVFRVGPAGQGLLILKADTVAQFITKANLMLSGMQNLLNEETEDKDNKD